MSTNLYDILFFYDFIGQNRFPEYSYDWIEAQWLITRPAYSYYIYPIHNNVKQWGKLTYLTLNKLSCKYYKTEHKF